MLELICATHQCSFYYVYAYKCKLNTIIKVGEAAMSVSIKVIWIQEQYTIVDGIWCVYGV